MQSVSVILPRFHRRARAFQRLSALGTSAIYVILYSAASFCLATGVFHVESPHEGQHHSHSHHHHHEHGPVRESAPAATTLDVCDFALQILSTPLCYLVPVLPVVAFMSQTQVSADASCTPLYLAIVHTIRAPPEDVSEVA